MSAGYVRARWADGVVSAVNPALVRSVTVSEKDDQGNRRRGKRWVVIAYQHTISKHWMFVRNARELMDALGAGE